MARSLVLANGSMCVCLDHQGMVRDLYYPYVGRENHIAHSDLHRVGVFVDNEMSWIGDDEWDVRIDYDHETLLSNVSAINSKRGLRVTFRDFVYNEADVFVRSVHVENRLNRTREVRVFFNQQFTIGGTSHADTAYYNPREHALVHYKGRRVFLISARSEGEPFRTYSVGLKHTAGMEGTWRDAEDGELAGNPIEHGMVDSTLGFSRALGPHESTDMTYWVAAGTTFKEARRLHTEVKRKTPRHIRETTHDFWQAWVNKKRLTFTGLDDEVVSLFKKSLLILRCHADKRGGILASTDGADLDFGRDTYGYVWPRDGAFIANAFDQAGYSDIARRFFEFSQDVLTDDGYILHKYQPDRSLGSSWHPWIQEGEEQLAIQQDETAIVLWAFWQHYKYTLDLEFVEGSYNSFVKRIADFLVRYRDPETGLPKESYDLWEEKYGVSTFTAASVAGALGAAANFADLLGKEEDAQLYRDNAQHMKRSITDTLYRKDLGAFVKLVRCEAMCDPTDADLTIDASSFFGIYQFGVLAPDDPRLITTRETTLRELSDPLPVGGVARYQGDQYHRRDETMPGNSWIITHLWMIQHEIARTTSERELRGVNESLRWVVRLARESGVLSEQVDPHTGDQRSVAPLAWSHAEYVRTVMSYLRKLERLGVADLCAPLE